MKSLSVFLGVVTVFITMPIWFFIVYTLLKSANVDRLVWFLFWVYVPFSMAVSVGAKVLEQAKLK